MMENAGLQLARLITTHASRKSKILFGIGTGNNGGGGLVAARRLAGWGYDAYLNLPDPNLKELPASQLNRALAFGAGLENVNQPDVFVDAYFGFSQRFPLPEIYLEAILDSQLLRAFKISLDLPSGFDKTTLNYLFTPDSILTLAAPKTELIHSGIASEIYIADIGIPAQLYKDLNVSQPDFSKSGFIKYSHKQSFDDQKKS